MRWVALFRGINVGRAKRVAMADLRALLVGLGYREVRTLLNSGNAVFDGAADTPAAVHAQRIQAAVAGQLGVDALVVVKSAPEMAAVVAGNPLGDVATDLSRLLVVFTHDAASLQALAGWAAVDWGTESARLGPHAAYLWCADGLLASPAATALLRDLAGAGTTRNAATVEKIVALLGAA